MSRTAAAEFPDHAHDPAFGAVADLQAAQEDWLSVRDAILLEFVMAVAVAVTWIV